jgi:hypothetical protein
LKWAIVGSSASRTTALGLFGCIAGLLMKATPAR